MNARASRGWTGGWPRGSLLGVRGLPPQNLPNITQLSSAQIGSHAHFGIVPHGRLSGIHSLVKVLIPEPITVEGHGIHGAGKAVITPVNTRNIQWVVGWEKHLNKMEVPSQWGKVRMILGGHQKCPLHQHIDKGVTRVSGKDEEALDWEFTNLDSYLNSFSNKLIELGESFHLSRTVLCHFWYWEVGPVSEVMAWLSYLLFDPQICFYLSYTMCVNQNLKIMRVSLCLSVSLSLSLSHTHTHTHTHYHKAASDWNWNEAAPLR